MARRRKDAGKPDDDPKELWDRVKASAAPIARNTVLPGALADEGLGPALKKSIRPPKRGPGPVSGRAKALPLLPTAVPAKTNTQIRDLAHGCAPGVDKRTAERLKKGRMTIEGRLDLHGMSREAAHRATIDYVLGARAAGKRCILIVTGKGKGILQTELPRWLNMAPLRAAILSFDHASPQDGGTGAVYVLIKRDRRL